MGINNPWDSYSVDVSDGRIYLVYKHLNYRTARQECSPVEISRELAQRLVSQLQDALKWKPDGLLDEYLEIED